MSTHRVWKGCLAVFFLLAVMSLVIQPVFAAEKTKSKEKEKVAASVQTPPQTHQESFAQPIKIYHFDDFLLSCAVHLN